MHFHFHLLMTQISSWKNLLSQLNKTYMSLNILGDITQNTKKSPPPFHTTYLPMPVLMKVSPQKLPQELPMPTQMKTHPKKSTLVPPMHPKSKISLQRTPDLPISVLMKISPQKSPQELPMPTQT